jgi:hypothetical protein
MCLDFGNNSLECETKAANIRRKIAYLSSMNAAEIISIDENILKGAPVFRGTRVPIKIYLTTSKRATH